MKAICTLLAMWYLLCVMPPTEAFHVSGGWNSGSSGWSGSGGRHHSWSSSGGSHHSSGGSWGHGSSGGSWSVGKRDAEGAPTTESELSHEAVV